MVNSEVLEQQQSQLASRTFLQVIDIQETAHLKQRLEQHLMQLKQLGYYVTTRPVKLSIVEKQWLSNQTLDELRIWSNNFMPCR